MKKTLFFLYIVLVAVAHIVTAASLSLVPETETEVKELESKIPDFVRETATMWKTLSRDCPNSETVANTMWDDPAIREKFGDDAVSAFRHDLRTKAYRDFAALNNSMVRSGNISTLDF